ncbi:MAG: PAS domain-containing protein [Megasphaera sp.]|nr:PAS domain-containing protein [Megasphaera sp.]MCH4187808.1 PAS domain-containing protein [Megasphaera sp.]MCH4218019.1 PAS domain-containing protein [Megasphaera sp.]
MVNETKGRETDDILQAYVPLVRFLADVMGPRCEVVLQDVRTPDHSIMSIRNGHISGRSVGGPLTNLTLKIISAAGETMNRSLVNYDSKNSHGEELVSSKYFIRDGDGIIIGVFSINILKPTCHDPNNQLVCEPCTFMGQAVNEYLDTSPEQIILHAVDEVLEHMGKNAGCLTMQEKRKVVTLLGKNGVFKIRRAVPQVARILGMADSTVYRYLAQLSQN